MKNILLGLLLFTGLTFAQFRAHPVTPRAHIDTLATKDGTSSILVRDISQLPFVVANGLISGGNYHAAIRAADSTANAQGGEDVVFRTDSWEFTSTLTKARGAPWIGKWGNTVGSSTANNTSRFVKMLPADAFTAADTMVKMNEGGNIRDFVLENLSITGVQADGDTAGTFFHLDTTNTGNKGTLDFGSRIRDLKIGGFTNSAIRVPGLTFFYMDGYRVDANEGPGFESVGGGIIEARNLYLDNTSTVDDYSGPFFNFNLRKTASTASTRAAINASFSNVRMETPRAVGSGWSNSLFHIQVDTTTAGKKTQRSYSVNFNNVVRSRSVAVGNVPWLFGTDDPSDTTFSFVGTNIDHNPSRIIKDPVSQLDTVGVGSGFATSDLTPLLVYAPMDQYNAQIVAHLNVGWLRVGGGTEELDSLRYNGTAGTERMDLYGNNAKQYSIPIPGFAVMSFADTNAVEVAISAGNFAHITNGTTNLWSAGASADSLNASHVSDRIKLANAGTYAVDFTVTGIAAAADTFRVGLQVNAATPLAASAEQFIGAGNKGFLVYSNQLSLAAGDRVRPLVASRGNQNFKPRHGMMRVRRIY